MSRGSKVQFLTETLFSVSLSRMIFMYLMLCCCMNVVEGNLYKGSIYMVFDYMDHDLTGLADRPGVRFTIPQMKVKTICMCMMVIGWQKVLVMI
jgi:hypothetical protein